METQQRDGFQLRGGCLNLPDVVERLDVFVTSGKASGDRPDHPHGSARYVCRLAVALLILLPLPPRLAPQHRVDS
ncbi:MAG: hypothetical protein ACXVFO_08040 [Solirubrobacteraceae bacterium]